MDETRDSYCLEVNWVKVVQDIVYSGSLLVTGESYATSWSVHSSAQFVLYDKQ